MQHPGDDLGFDLAERWFAVTLEIFGDAHADLVLDFDVGIRERQRHQLRDLLADTGLPGAHHADDDGDWSVGMVSLLGSGRTVRCG